MPNLNQIIFLKSVREYIKEPILIIGSKEYEYDEYNFLNELNKLEFFDITGLDINHGSGVDVVMDICDLDAKYIQKKKSGFKTVLCMQTMYAVKNPFYASQNIQKLLAKDGTLVFSDIFSHKINRVPTDYWRFTFDGQKILFENIEFIESLTKIGVTRKNILIDYSLPLPEILKYTKNDSETFVAYFLRKVYVKLFSNSFMNNQRLLPELSIHSLGIKK